MVQAAVRTEPGLRERAVAIVDGSAPVWSVAGRNEAAAGAGIALDMTKSQAQQFCDIEIRHRSRSQEKAAHAALMDLAWSISPRVEDTAPDTVVLDLAGLNSLFGPDETIARQLAKRALGLGLDAQIAVAVKIETATIAARGFAGVTVIPEGEERKILGSLPVGVLFHSLETSFKSVFVSTNPETPFKSGLANTNSETLDRWGVRTCEALAALPVLELSERLGQEGVRLHELALGQSDRAMVVAEPAIHFSINCARGWMRGRSRRARCG
jgi:protein ImuB